MPIIVTYDVPKEHTPLKQSLFKLGYSDKIVHVDEKGVNRYIYLPNTTLYHPTKTAEQARIDVQTACKNLNIELERCVSTLWTGWAAIWGGL